MDRVTAYLLEALKAALADPAEQRLFRSGKLAGLFRSRAGLSGEAARRALDEKLLEVIRTEPRGSLQIEWVRATPAAVAFVHAHESPLSALKELRAELRATQQNLPRWLHQIQQTVEALGRQVAAEVEAVARRLEALSHSAQDAIARLEAAQPQLPEALAELMPWANGALRYLDRRVAAGDGVCPLSELFSAVRTDHPALTVSEFHGGLRRLFDRGVLRLLPAGAGNSLPEPEYALLDGLHTYYFVTRAGNEDWHAPDSSGPSG